MPTMKTCVACGQSSGEKKLWGVLGTVVGRGNGSIFLSKHGHLLRKLFHRWYFTHSVDTEKIGENGGEISIKLTR